MAEIGALLDGKPETISGKIQTNMTEREFMKRLKKNAPSARIVGRVKNGKLKMKADGNGLAKIAIFAAGIKSMSAAYGTSTQEMLDAIKKKMDEMEDI